MAARPPLHSLTSLRFLTALHVFFFHLEAAGLAFAPAPFRALASIGYVGVNWFFVLSGFILAYSYAGRPLARRVFWRARLVRVVPAYWVGLLLAMPLYVYVCFFTAIPDEQAWIGAMREHAVLFSVLSALLLQAWIPAAALSVNNVGWSLSAEAFFYLLFPFLLHRLAANTSRRLLLLLLLFATLSMAIAGVYVVASPDGVAVTTYDRNELVWLNVLRFNPLIRLPEFMIGVCGGLLMVRRVPRQSWATVLVLGGSLALLCASWGSARVPYPLLHNGLLSLPFLAIIVGFALRPPGMAFLEWPTFRKLGEASYSFFLTHGLVIAIYFQPDGKPRGVSILEIAACLALSIALATLLYHAVEQPMRRRFAKKIIANPGDPLESQTG
ncbi:MAG: acyltransferase [Betaproteobacteria bacterium]|nr:acyltransferase [Betaproteobacteria bacterium]